MWTDSIIITDDAGFGVTFEVRVGLSSFTLEIEDDETFVVENELYGTPQEYQFSVTGLEAALWDWLLVRDVLCDPMGRRALGSRKNTFAIQKVA